MNVKVALPFLNSAEQKLLTELGYVNLTHLFLSADKKKKSLDNAMNLFSFVTKTFVNFYISSLEHVT